MSFSVNRATLLGNVTQEPTLRSTPDGTAVCSFSIATNHSIKQGEEWKDIPTFHNVVVWGKKAEWLGKELKKGFKIYVEGRINNKSWEDENGIKKYRTEIVADEVIMMTRAIDNSETTAPKEAKTEEKKEEKVDLGLDSENDFEATMDKKAKEDVIDINEIPF